MKPFLHLIEPAGRSLDAETLAALWNKSYPDELAVSARLITWCKDPVPGRSVTVRVLQQDEKPAAFVIASTLHGYTTGWVDALAVAQKGAGRTIRLPLLAAAEQWMREEGCETISIGGGPWSLMRGIPAPLRRQRVLNDCGYRSSVTGAICDLAIDLARYTPPASLGEVPGVVYPAQPRDVDNIVALLAEPVSLQSLADEVKPNAGTLAHIRRLLDGGRLGDLMLLWTVRGLEGICQIVFPDSALPVERIYPYELTRPWSALDSVLVRKNAFDWGAAAILDGSLRRLHNNGVNSCVAPGITRTSTFEKFGFRIYRRWQHLVKTLE